MQTVKILGVKINNISLENSLKLALKYQNDNKAKYICTPNPEIILSSQKNDYFKKVLNNSSLNIPDGLGLIWASYFISSCQNSKSNIYLQFIKSYLLLIFNQTKLKTVISERVTGVDLMLEICKKSEKKIFLLGAKKGVAEKAAIKIKELNPKVKIVGTFSGSPHKNKEKEIINLINQSSANTLFVAFGAPKQELWINRNLKKLQNIKLAIGVGGSFDFIAGTKKRAPKFMQKIGLEWLFRLIQEPIKRSKRIFNATIKFPLEILKKQLKKD